MISGSGSELSVGRKMFEVVDSFGSDSGKGSLTSLTTSFTVRSDEKRA